MKTKLRGAVELELCREAKLCDLLGDAANERFEASGVVAIDEVFYVIFDNTSQIGCIGGGLSPGNHDNRLIVQRFDRDEGYEDIAHDRSSGRFFILIESLPHRRGYFAKVREYDSGFSYIASRWLDWPLPSPNKGVEGLTCLRRAGQLYLLGLCEGNRCKDGAAGRRKDPGVRQDRARMGSRRHDPAAIVVAVRGLQQPGARRRPPVRRLPRILGPVGGQVGAVRVAGRRRRCRV